MCNSIVLTNVRDAQIGRIDAGGEAEVDKILDQFPPALVV